jgi:hypothetical protein
VKRQDLINFARQLSDEDDAAFMLWTWLPSHKVAEKHHGDYASEFRPSNLDVMKEAAMYLGHLKHPDVPLTEEEKDWFETCPCDESHKEAAP